jgi:hypothetical protein
MLPGSQEANVATASKSQASGGSPIIPGRPVPRPTSHDGWLEIGRALISEMRHEYAIPEGLQTVAVGWTDVAALSAKRFPGASREIRAVTILPTPSQHIVTPRMNALSQDHAEQDVINGFIDAVAQSKIDVEREHSPTLWMFVSQDVCTACRQGNEGTPIEPGVLMQLSLRYPNLLISVGWEAKGGKLGHLSFLAGSRTAR